MKKYTIYYIPAKPKIGCTDREPKERVEEQGFKEFEILEVHEDIYVASIRERELQKQYGLKIDPLEYWETVSRHTFEGRSKGGKKAGKNNVESGHLDRIRNKQASKKAGMIAVITGQLERARKSRAYITKELGEKIKKEYPNLSMEKIAYKYNASYGVIRRIIKEQYKNYKD